MEESITKFPKYTPTLVKYNDPIEVDPHDIVGELSES